MFYDLAAALLPNTATPFPPGDPAAPAPLDDATASAANGFALVLLFGMLLVALASFVVWVWSIIDAAKRDDTEWAAAGKNKVLWIVLIALLGVLASLVYLVAARPALKEAARKQRSGLGSLAAGFTPPPGYGTTSYGQIPATATHVGAAGHAQMPATAADEAYRSAYPQQTYTPPAYPGTVQPHSPSAPASAAPAPAPEESWKATVYQPPAPPTAG